MNFDECFARVVSSEGGYLSPQAAAAQGDPGGETKYGISKRAHPTVDIANLTIDQAKQIYKVDYWGPSGCEALPDGLRLIHFDTAVNSGTHQAIQFLQRAVGVEADGILGPKTLQAVGTLNVPALVARVAAQRLLFLTSLLNFNVNARGWVKRVAMILSVA